LIGIRRRGGKMERRKSRRNEKTKERLKGRKNKNACAYLS
jgi:hypothetical protein